MPIYCYEDENGTIYERIFSIMAQIPAMIKLEDGTTARRSHAAEHKSIPTSKGWPIECYASGVHPEQADSLREEFQKAGVPTEVSRDGNPIYRDARHRRKALKARGLIDRSSYL